MCMKCIWHNIWLRGPVVYPHIFKLNWGWRRNIANSYVLQRLKHFDTYMFLVCIEMSLAAFLSTYRWGIWDSVKGSDCAQIESGRVRTQIQVFWPLVQYSFCYDFTKFSHHEPFVKELRKEPMHAVTKRRSWNSLEVSGKPMPDKSSRANVSVYMRSPVNAMYLPSCLENMELWKTGGILLYA